jgi:Ulp1 family protease
MKDRHISIRRSVEYQVPEQQDSSNCGVFACLHMLSIILGYSYDNFDMNKGHLQNMRGYIAWHLLGRPSDDPIEYIKNILLI